MARTGSGAFADALNALGHVLRTGLCYATDMSGLNHGELFIIAFVVLTVLLAPYSGRVGQWLFSLTNQSKDS